MAIRRAKMKAQVIEKLTQAAPAGETFIACIHAETGPSPWLNAIFDEVPGLGLVVAFTRKFYFLTLTNTSIVVNSANRFTNRPGDIVAVFPIEAFPVSRVKRVRVWNSLYVAFQPGAKPTRLNVHGYWRHELDQFIAVFPQSALADAPVIPAQATAPAGDSSKTV